MSAITDLVGGIVAGLGKTAIDIRTAITGISPDKQAAITELTMNLQAQAAQAENQLIMVQAEINKQEAASTNMFVAGARPFIMWVCGAALAFQYLLRPLAQWALVAFKSDIILPQLDLAQLYPVLIALLGLGTMRSVEKINGAQGNH